MADRLRKAVHRSLWWAACTSGAVRPLAPAKPRTSAAPRKGRARGERERATPLHPRPRARGEKARERTDYGETNERETV